MVQKIFKGRRKFLIGLSALAAGGLTFDYNIFNQRLANADTNKLIPPSNAKLGINLAGVEYWATEMPFVDIMHQSSAWVSQIRSGKWGKGPALDLDEHGWVKRLTDGAYATKVLCASNVPYPRGTYTLLYDGEGEIQIKRSVGTIKQVAAGKLEIEVKATKKTMFSIDLVATNPENYLRNIRVIMPGFEQVYQDNPWHPAFLKRWAGVACIRLMDMMATNNADLVSWAERPKPADASYTEKGVPVELLVDLANRLEAEPWFCMPHQADDDYVKQFAKVVKATLKPSLRAWVEYSNEIWNGGFAQHRYASKQGQDLGLGKSKWASAFHYNARRSVQIFDIWEAVYAGHDRFVRVIASQASNAWLSDQLLSKVMNKADVLAIAPYISLIVSPKSKPSAKTIANWSLNKLFAHINEEVLPKSKESMLKSKKIADKFGVKLVAYEAGQHLVGVQSAQNNQQLTDLFKQANADRRMGDVYAQNLKDWEMVGGDLMCTFNSVQSWSKFGSWGLMEQADQPTAKFKAVMQWAKSRGQKVSY